MAAKRGRPAKSAKKTTKPTKKSVPETKWWKDYQFTSSELVRRTLLFLVLVYAFLNYRGLFIAATVNNRPISRLSVIRELEAQSGQQALDTLVNETLIRQRLADSHVEVTQAEIDAEVASYEEQFSQSGQSFETVLASEGMTRQDFRDQIEIQLGLEKLLASDINITDDEVNEYKENAAGFFPEGLSEEEQTELAREQLTQQKLSQRFSTWIEEVRAEAEITYFAY